MKWLLVLSLLPAVIFLPSLPAADPVPAGAKKASLEDLPDYEKFSADSYIAAAASLQASGEEKAAVLLADLAKGRGRADEMKVVILCRMLFTAKPKGEFRRAAIGAPVFVGSTAGKDWLNIFRNWPLEPLELVDGVPFFVVIGYSLGGCPEPAGKYLDYCFRNCDWNTEVFKPKTREEKRRALAKLVASPKWNEPLTERAKKALSDQIE